jgi:tryptophan synthase alpha subunit
MKLSLAIDDANRRGRLGLVVYTVPSFPDPWASSALLEDLERRPAVSIVEMTFAVDEAFSEHANDTIRTAHRAALRHAPEPRRILSAYPLAKPSLCVLYQRTVREFSFEGVVSDMQGRVDGMLLEWSEAEIERYDAIARRAGVELVQCVGPWMSAGEIERIASFCWQGGLLYLMSAPMTGARLFGRPELEETVAVVKSLRPDVKIAAGFGVRTASDLRLLAQVRGLDGAIIGTAFLEAAASGPAAAAAYLDEIEGGLAR